MRILFGIATAALCAAVATGCSDAPDAAAPDVSAPPAVVQRDIPGLAEIFRGIGAPESVVWMTWSDPPERMRTPGLPGPTPWCGWRRRWPRP